MVPLLEYLPFLLPIILIELALTVAALIHIYRHKTYRVGNRLIWTIIAFVQIVGPICYFIFGRGEDE